MYINSTFSSNDVTVSWDSILDDNDSYDLDSTGSGVALANLSTLGGTIGTSISEDIESCDLESIGTGDCVIGHVINTDGTVGTRLSDGITHSWSKTNVFKLDGDDILLMSSGPLFVNFS